VATDRPSVSNSTAFAAVVEQSTARYSALDTDVRLNDDLQPLTTHGHHEGCVRLRKWEAVRDERGDVHTPGCNERNRPREYIVHATNQHERKPFPAGRRRRKCRTIIARDAGQHNATARPDDVNCRFDGLVVSGDLKRDIDADSAAGGLQPFRIAGRCSVQYHVRAEALGGRASVRQGVARYEVLHPADPQNLQQTQPDGATPDDGDARSQADVAKIERVDRDAQGFQHRAVAVAQLIRQQMQEIIGPREELLQSAVLGRMAGEDHIATQIAIPPRAHIAPKAWNRRVDGNSLPITTTTSHNTGELVADHQWTSQPDFTDAALRVPMQIRTTQTDRGDLDQALACRWNGNRFLSKPKIADTVEPRHHRGPRVQLPPWDFRHADHFPRRRSPRVGPITTTLHRRSNIEVHPFAWSEGGLNVAVMNEPNVLVERERVRVRDHFETFNEPAISAAPRERPVARSRDNDRARKAEYPRSAPARSGTRFERYALCNRDQVRHRRRRAASHPDLVTHPLSRERPERPDASADETATMRRTGALSGGDLRS
jgi:hypothetical protein